MEGEKKKRRERGVKREMRIRERHEERGVSLRCQEWQGRIERSKVGR